MQDKITAEIAGALAIRVTQVEQRRASAKPTESLEAYDYVLRARPALQRPTAREHRGGARTAQACHPARSELCRRLRRARRDLLYRRLDGLGGIADGILGRAEEMANKALSLDDADVRARVVLGRIHIFYHRYEQAKAEIDRAIAINPNDAHGLAGRGNILMWSGQTDAAIEALELAQRIDPELNAVDRFALSLAYYLKRRYDAAIEQAELNLRKTAGREFQPRRAGGRLCAAEPAEDAARVVAMIHRWTRRSIRRTFGSKFLNPADLDHLRDGFRKAGLYTAEASPASR